MYLSPYPNLIITVFQLLYFTRNLCHRRRIVSPPLHCHRRRIVTAAALLHGRHFVYGKWNNILDTIPIKRMNAAVTMWRR